MLGKFPALRSQPGRRAELQARYQKLGRRLLRGQLEEAIKHCKMGLGLREQKRATLNESHETINGRGRSADASAPSSEGRSRDDEKSASESDNPSAAAAAAPPRQAIHARDCQKEVVVEPMSRPQCVSLWRGNLRDKPEKDVVQSCRKICSKKKYKIETPNPSQADNQETFSPKDWRERWCTGGVA